MIDKEFKSVTPDGRIVYNLDAISAGPVASRQTVQALANANQLALPSASMALVNTLQDTRQIFKPLFESLEHVRQISRNFQIQADLAKTIAESFQRLALPKLFIDFRFEILQPLAPTETNQTTEIASLTVDIDEFGQFIIGGQRIVRANANSSKHGKLLSLFEATKAKW